VIISCHPSFCQILARLADTMPGETLNDPALQGFLLNGGVLISRDVNKAEVVWSVYPEKYSASAALQEMFDQK